MFRKYKPEPVNATYTAEASMSSEELTEFMESLPETDFLEYQKGFGYGPGHEGWTKIRRTLWKQSEQRKELQVQNTQ